MLFNFFLYEKEKKMECKYVETDRISYFVKFDQNQLRIEKKKEKFIFKSFGVLTQTAFLFGLVFVFLFF